MFSKRANEVSNQQHYDAASTSSDSVRLSSRHHCTKWYVCLEQLVAPEMLAYVLCYPLYGKSCSSDGPKMSIHDLTSTSLATLASEVLRLENDVCLCRVAT